MHSDRERKYVRDGTQPGVPTISGSKNEYSYGFLAAASIVLTLRLITNISSSFNEAIYYTDMATHGVFGNPHLAAPFAYRIAVPSIVRFITILSGVAVSHGFIFVATISAVIILFFSYLIARNIGAGRHASIITICLLGCSFYQIKYPLFIPSMVDIEGSIMMLLAMWTLYRREFGLCVLLSTLGVLFKEFLLIPPALLIITLLTEIHRENFLKTFFFISTTIIIVGAAFALPRIIFKISPSMDFQEIHRYPQSVRLNMLVRTIFDYRNDINVLFALIGYWLPTILLATRERIAHAIILLGDKKINLLPLLTLVVIFALYGGTNHPIFITYSLIAQILVLSAFIDHKIKPWEIIYVFFAIVIFNRIPFIIPLPTADFYGFIEFYGGWSTLVTWKTLERSSELIGFILISLLLRKMLWKFYPTTQSQP